jgi:ABC-2 type transport system permease protein
MSGPASSAPRTTAVATSSIYDLGYRGYDGPRLGRRAAADALFRHSFRMAFGLGRSARSKVAPMVLAGIALLPAVFAIGVAAIVSQAGEGGQRLADASPVRYATYFSVISPLVMLFCAAQAPELFGRDQRYGVVPLYFSRELSRTDYATTRMLGLIVAVLAVVAVPQLLLFVGRVLAAPDLRSGVELELPSLPPVLLQGTLTAVLLGGLAAVVAAWTPRKAYATTMIIALFLIPPILTAILVGLRGSGPIDLVILASATDVLDATNALLFDTRPEGASAVARLPDWLYFAAAIVGSVGSVLLVVHRYRRIVA